VNECAVRPAVDRAAAVAVLRAVEPHAIDDATAADMAEGCVLFDVMEHGRAVGAVAIEIAGQVATIKAAASYGHSTYDELALIERGLRNLGIKRVAMFTRRPGLVRRLVGTGYRLREAELEKDL
jgi:hypothetical protein